jgi:hypothetical protein
MPELGRDATGELVNMVLAGNVPALAQGPLVGSVHSAAVRRVVEPGNCQPIHLA